MPVCQKHKVGHLGATNINLVLEDIWELWGRCHLECVGQLIYEIAMLLRQFYQSPHQNIFRVANGSQIVHSNSTIQHDHNVNDSGPPPSLEASEFSEMSDLGTVYVSRSMKLGVCIMLPCFQIITSTISQIFLGKISTALLHVHVYYLHSVQL